MKAKAKAHGGADPRKAQRPGLADPELFPRPRDFEGLELLAREYGE